LKYGLIILNKDDQNTFKSQVRCIVCVHDSLVYLKCRWSFGNLMYEMATLGCMPYAGMSAEELLDKLKTGYRMKQPSTCSDAM